MLSRSSKKIARSFSVELLFHPVSPQLVPQESVSPSQVQDLVLVLVEFSKSHMSTSLWPADVLR